MRNYIIKRKLFIFLISILVIATLLVSFTPFIIKYYVNHHIFGNMKNYTGHVDDVDTYLLRGTYVLKNMEIRKNTAKKSAPFFSTEELNIWLSWEALRKGKILAEASLVEAKLNFVQSRDSKKKQHGQGLNWLAVFEKILPATLHQLTVIQSEVRYANPDAQPEIDLRVENINAYIENLTNVRDLEGNRVANGRLTATIFKQTDILTAAEFDPFAYDDFLFAASIQHLDLTQTNNLMNNFFQIDFKSGSGDLFTEISAENRKLSGYIKPLMKDVDIASWSQDIQEQHDNIPRFIWENLIGFLNGILTNPGSDKVATQIELSGDFDKIEVNSFGAFLGFIKNAYFSALKSRFEGKTGLMNNANSKDNDNDNDNDNDKKDD
ncbi:hypothetical protein TDB9533_02488 [Thalassocella blandensis]|nr:hypothetical protein TDB9533_02488 [Thalassocella blandensis]